MVSFLYLFFLVWFSNIQISSSSPSIIIIFIPSVIQTSQSNDEDSIPDGTSTCPATSIHLSNTNASSIFFHHRHQMPTTFVLFHFLTFIISFIIIINDCFWMNEWMNVINSSIEQQQLTTTSSQIINVIIITNHHFFSLLNLNGWKD